MSWVPSAPVYQSVCRYQHSWLSSFRRRAEPEIKILPPPPPLPPKFSRQIVGIIVRTTDGRCDRCSGSIISSHSRHYLCRRPTVCVTPSHDDRLIHSAHQLYTRLHRRGPIDRPRPTSRRISNCRALSIPFRSSHTIVKVARKRGNTVRIAHVTVVSRMRQEFIWDTGTTRIIGYCLLNANDGYRRLTGDQCCQLCSNDVAVTVALE